MKQVFKTMGLGLLCLGVGFSDSAAAKDKQSGEEKEAPVGNRRLKGEPADSPRLTLPVDVFDEPAVPLDASTARAMYCPKDEGYDWGRLQGAAGFDEAYAAAAACDRVFTAGYAQGQLGTLNGPGGYDVVVRSSLPDGSTDWVKYFGTAGSTANDQATSVAVVPGTCNSTDLYVAGYTNGALAGTHKGGSDVFLVRYHANTQAERWRIQLGSSGTDNAYGVATDAAGNAYVVGSTNGNLGFRTPPTGTTDMFIAKYLANGTLAWVHQLGVNGKATIARGVSVGANGAIYVTGYTTGGLSGQVYKGGSADAFIVRYKDMGNSGTLERTLLLGTAGTDYAYGITTAQEASGTFVYVTGQTNAAFAGNTNKGAYDVFTARLDDNLNPPTWLKQEGGTGNDYAYSIAYNKDQVIVAGASETDYTTDAALGSSDMLMIDYAAQTGKRLLTEHLGGPARETARGVAVDGQERVFLAGSSDGKICDGAGETFTGGFFDSMVLSFNNSCRISKKDPRCDDSGATGDPHYFTFDKLFYDFQASGDFVLARMEGDASFDVQGRQCAWSPGASVATFRNVGALVGTNRVEVLSNGEVWVNGAAKTLTTPLILPGGGVVSRSNAAYTVSWPTGERLSATPAGSYMNVFLAVPKSRLGTIRGLFGDGDGSKDNEYMRRDGSQLASLLTFGDMYHGLDSLATHWRVQPGVDSLLLEHGTDCTDLGAPRTLLSLPALTPEQRAAGEAACAAITDPALKDDCILDVGATGNPVLAEASAELIDRREKAGHDTDVPVAKVVGVYFNNFTGNIGGEWDSIVTNVTPLGGRMFLGEFGNQNVRLTLNSLGTHTKLAVSFDLYVINAWTGENAFFGSPTTWKASADGVELVNATFSNWDGTFQSYPFPGMPAQTDAIEIDSLGYPYRDSVYRIKLNLDHTASNLTLDLSAEGLSGLMGESWGVTNFEIQGR
ncbi:MAG TPA: SBBP repeat-containing protein [Archangium sp.]|uniref:SBBP repeat-containing protein n=1 Tax=Archangium sp. TaxID=1872627 RepID=UPI002ED80917